MSVELLKYRLITLLVMTALPFLSIAGDGDENDRMMPVLVLDAIDEAPLAYASVVINGQDGYTTDLLGQANIPFGSEDFRVSVTYIGYKTLDTLVQPSKATLPLTFRLYRATTALKAAVITDEQGLGNGPTASIDHFTVFAAKKAEIIRPTELPVNVAMNNARQLFAKVAGLNIFESGDGGAQLSIGGRGLNPNRTSNFNTRQNGYDISADPLGYPETYYTPPMQAIERIELIRGAASLQFGPQFGGMLNFDLIDAPQRKFGLISEQAYASFNTFSSFNAIGSDLGKLDVFAYLHHRRGDGWRDFSAFQSNNAHVSLAFASNEHSSLRLEYTHYSYLGQQPGGLTDRLFERDPSTVLRERNWFNVEWDLAAIVFEHKFNPITHLQVRPFMLRASRKALGHLGRISRLDPGGERDLIVGNFNNLGVEARLRYDWHLGSLPSTLVTGVRYFDGNTTSRQGAASDDDGADFQFIENDAINASDYHFSNHNAAVFAEQIFRVSEKVTITPGIRYEYIQTSASGQYTRVLTDGAGNILPTWPRTTWEDDLRTRQILLAGIGVSRKFKGNKEVFVNLSRNYRAINFSDIRISNPNQVVDPNIHDEQGYTADLGFRGTIGKWLYIDASYFALFYNDKIGNRLDEVVIDPNVGPQLVQLRGNIADAITHGIEFMTEADLLGWWKHPDWKLRVFANVAHIESYYISDTDASIDGNIVEYVPEWNIKTGARLHWRNFFTSWQFTYVSEQFTDATNAPAGADPNAVVGAVPAYQVQDLSLGFRHKVWTIQTGVDNVLDTRYFTRRASGYPGPGILPADPRNVYISVRYSLWS